MIFELLKAILLLFMILDPPGNLPVFFGLTQGMSKKERKKIFRKTIWIGSLLLVCFAILGGFLLEVFKIKISSFSIAGGLLLLILAIDIIKGKEKQYESAAVAVVPMATPLLVGPGAITAVMLILHQHGYLFTLAVVAIVIALLKLFFWKAYTIYKLLGKSGSLIIAKLTGLIIAAIGVEFIINGLIILEII